MTNCPENKPAEKSSEKASTTFLLVALLFFFSGASSLIYQVIWTRQMVFVFGSSTFASATVLSAFMGGLALGSFVAGKKADKLRNPFLIYGLLEATIGIWAIATPFMFSAALPIYKIFWQQLHLSVLPFSLLRFVVVSMILLVPTACMGATLPLLSRFITTSISAVAHRVGTLYAINTLGAVAGALSGGFFLIPAFGLTASTLSAAAVNLLLGAAVLTLTRRSPDFSAVRKTQESLPAKTGLPESTMPLSRPALATLVAFGISGAIAMIYEVAWTRALCLVIGSTTYAFSIMLSTFLVGIAYGSYQSARIADRAKDPTFWFAVLQVLLGAGGIFSIILFNYLPYWNCLANQHIIANPDLGMAVRFLLAAAILLPVTILLGSVFPLAVKACTLEFSRVGRSIGNLYSVNTLGAIIGSFAAGFIIIPSIGGEQTLICCAAANIVLGSVLFMFCSSDKIQLRVLSLLLALGTIIWAVQTPSIWDLHMITAGQLVRRRLNYIHVEKMSFAEFQKMIHGDFDILSWKDGLCANVAIVRFTDSKQISLFTNGHIDASDGLDMPTQALLSSIPLLLKPLAREIGDIGWGSGCTMGYALLFPIKKIVCVEIEPAVIETSQFFHKVNMAPEDDHRLCLEMNDGRNYLLATNENFDVLISEPSNPWQAGVCNLYTKEYFQICHDRLKPGGIFTMWWQCNQVSSDNLCSVFSALKKVFRQVVVFQTSPGDIAVCASDQPIKINLKAVEEALENSHLRKQLREKAGILSPEDLPLSVRMADDAITKVVANVQPNTDDRNIIEFDLSKNYEQRNRGLENHLWMQENSGKFYDVIDWGNLSAQTKAAKMAALAEIAMGHNNDMAELWARESFELFANPVSLEVQALISAQRKGDFEESIVKADEAVKRFPNQAGPLLVRGIVELLGGAPTRARRDLEAALKLDPENTLYKFRLAQTYMPELKDWYQIANLPLPDTGKADTDPNKVIELINPALKDSKFVIQNPAALATLGAALLQVGRLQDGIKTIQNYRHFRPDDMTSLNLLAQAYTRIGDGKNASLCSKRAAELSKDMAAKLALSTQVLLANKKENLALNMLRRALKYYPDSSEARAVLKMMAKTNKDAADFLNELPGSGPADAKAPTQLEPEQKSKQK